MYDRVFLELQNKRTDILRGWKNETCRNADVQDAVLLGDTASLGHCSVIARENIAAAIRFKNTLEESFAAEKQRLSLLLHGSTAHGQGWITPNIDHELVREDEVFLQTTVVPECRDDLDLLLLVDSTDAICREAHRAAEDISSLGIDITVNLLSWEIVHRELAHPDSPALRRILLFNAPVVLLGEEYLEPLGAAARENQSWLDVPHEVDFKLLMQLAGILSEEKLTSRRFPAGELLMLFPTLYLAAAMDMHIGFPRDRVKIKKERKGVVH